MSIYSARVKRTMIEKALRAAEAEASRQLSIALSEEVACLKEIAEDYRAIEEQEIAKIRQGIG